MTALRVLAASFGTAFGVEIAAVIVIILFAVMIGA